MHRCAGAAADVVESRTAYTVVAEDLKRQILNGALSPGTRLPSDGDLRETYGVGQSTIREALRTLASEHLVRSVRGVNGGSFVTIPTVGHLGSQLEVGVTLLASADSISLDNLMEIRHITEVPAVGYAASRRTGEDIENLRSSDPSLNSEKSSFTDHSTFHQRIVEAAHNPLLEVVTIPLFNAIQNVVGEANAAKNIGESVSDDHSAIFDAIVRGDSMSAMALMRTHLDSVSAYYRSLEMLSSAQGGPGAE